MSLPLDNHVALVTGASRGIGRAVALDLARAGAHIIALARTQGALEELDDEIQAIGQQATLVPCDITDFPALDRLGLVISQRWGKLDVFVGNAGILGPPAPLSHIDPPDWERVFAVNVTANWRLIRSLDASLRAAPAGRVVLISSEAGSKAELSPYRGPYATTKAALDAIGRTYAAETATTSNVRVMLTDPGPMRTRMRASLAPGEDPMLLQTPEEFSPRVVEMCLPTWNETGKLFDFQSGKIKSFRAPE